MSLGIVLTVTALLVAAITSIVGIWVERDPRRAKHFAYVLSGLIIMASGVSIAQAYMDELANEKMEADMARMLVMLNEIAAKDGGGSPELQALIKTELNTQSRANPEIINKVAQRISDGGGDPSSTLGSYLPASEMEDLNRKGNLKTKKSSMGKEAAAKRAKAKKAKKAKLAEAKKAKAEKAAKAKAEKAAKAKAAKAKEEKAAKAKAEAEKAKAKATAAKAAKAKDEAAKAAAAAKATAAKSKARAAKKAAAKKASAAKKKASAAKAAASKKAAQAKAKAAAAKKAAAKKAAAVKAKASAAKKKGKKAFNKAKKGLKGLGF